MQAYSAGFARVYNQRWVRFAQNAAPLIRQFYETTPVSNSSRTLLDLCCGTGQLAVHFLENGYRVTGIDLSPAMLEHARANTLAYGIAGLAQFIQADAADFSLSEPVGLVVSTFDSLNHLPDFHALQNCFACVYRALIPTGIFIFDLNTRLGITTHWNGVMVEDAPDFFILNRAVWIEESQRGYTRITGFQRREDGLFERFEQTAYNSVFDMQATRDALLEAGFQDVYFAELSNLSKPIENPEQQNRVWFVVKKDKDL